MIVRIGMRGIDQRVDALRGKIIGQARGAAEAADADRHGCGTGEAVRPASDSVTSRSARWARRSAKQARFRGAAENEDACACRFLSR